MKHFFLVILSLVISQVAFSQCTTVTLQPDGTDGKDAFIITNNVSSNSGTMPVYFQQPRQPEAIR